MIGKSAASWQQVGNGAAGDEKRGWKNAHQKKIFAKVPIWWQEKTANWATFAAET
ncbi:MAG: hypothetical protein ACLTNQ_12255 [Phocaeicola coprophilus]